MIQRIANPIIMPNAQPKLTHAQKSSSLVFIVIPCVFQTIPKTQGSFAHFFSEYKGLLWVWCIELSI